MRLGLRLKFWGWGCVESVIKDTAYLGSRLPDPGWKSCCSQSAQMHMQKTSNSGGFAV